MNYILLSGGSGKRLWPLSNDVRSKQFIKIFRDSNGKYESMLQRVYGQIGKMDSNAKITIATSKSQVSSIHNQVGENTLVCVEPCRRDTFPAIALATAYLRDVCGADSDEVVVVCPVDPYVDDSYFDSLKEIAEEAKCGSGLVLMGIEPTHPSESFGYIIPENKDRVSKVQTFKEKPDCETAKQYISKGALWNGGVFAFKLSYIADRTKEILGYNDYDKLYASYSELPKISFDYAIVEKASSVRVVRFGGKWKDIGTWNTLATAMDEQCIGKAVMSTDCSNVNIINELDIPILCMGISDAVIAAGPEGILVSNKAKAAGIKPYVEKLDDRVMYAEKSWGTYQVLDYSEDSLVVKLRVMPGMSMSGHHHLCRDEAWNVVSGEGYAIIENEKRHISSGDVFMALAGMKHRIEAVSDLVLIEVQTGRILKEDKIKENI